MNRKDTVKVNGDVLQRNMQQIDAAHTVTYIIGGIIAGVLGLTGFEGLLILLVVAGFSAVLFTVKTKFNVKGYTNISLFDLVKLGISSHLMSFILFWTLTYALVHIY